MTAQLDLLKPRVQDLVEAVRWVEDAVSTVDVGLDATTSFLIREGYIHATNGRMVAAAPFPFAADAILVPAAPLAKLLRNKPDGEFTWDLADDKVTLKRGRFRGSVKRLPVEEWVAPTTHGVFERPPATLLDCIEVLLPFCSENATQPWATCLCLRQGWLYSTNNVVLARSPLLSVSGDKLPPTTDLLIPRWVAQFVCDRKDGLIGWDYGEHHIAFQWANGGWMRSSLINASFPQADVMISKLLEMAEPDVEITPAWKSCVRRVGKIADDPIVRLRASGVVGRTGEVMEVEDDATTPVPDGIEETMWDLRFLDPVLDAATHWNPLAWPQPATFRGEHIEGAILGRREL